MSSTQSEDWWPADFSLPAAKALADVLPGSVREAFDHYLPDADRRAEVVAGEPDRQEQTARRLTRLLQGPGLTCCPCPQRPTPLVCNRQRPTTTRTLAIGPVHLPRR